MQTAYSKTAVGEEQMKNKMVTRCFTHNFSKMLYTQLLLTSVGKVHEKQWIWL